jgi:DNA-binding PadR family transcriptional regulator
MDNSHTIELEILITISQNKTVPTCHFQHLFEHKWKTYYPRFNELKSDGVFNTTTPITGLPYYELTSKGKTRITELIEQRESEISARLSQFQQQRTAAAPYWKTVRARLQSVVHIWAPVEKKAGLQRRSDLDLIKAWFKRAKLIPHKA